MSAWPEYCLMVLLEFGGWPSGESVQALSHPLEAAPTGKLYYQNPQLGFHVMRLIVARLMRDTEIAHTRRSERAHIGEAPAVAAPPT